MARYALFCLIMGLFKEEVPVFAKLWPVRFRVRVSFTTGAVRSAILATSGLLVFAAHISTTSRFDPVRVSVTDGRTNRHTTKAKTRTSIASRAGKTHIAV